MNFWTRLRSFIKRLIFKKIPFEIDNDELLVRGIVTPLFYSESKNALKREAFLPPPNKRDVSLLRRRYTTDDFCKDHSAGLRISQQRYCGLSTFRMQIISDLNNIPGQNVQVEVVATPINEHGDVILNPPVFVKDGGLPMHADILYPSIIERGAIQTEFREYANKLLRLASFYSDPSPNTPGWQGSALS